MGWGRAFALTLVAAVLFGCGDQEVTLPGERVDIRADLSAPLDPTDATPAAGRPVNRAAPISLPAAQRQRELDAQGGLGRPPRASARAEPGADAGLVAGHRRGQLAPPPPDGRSGRAGRAGLHDGLQARVTALTTGGQVIWSREMTRPGDRAEDASGGGLAVQGNRLFVASAFGEL